jgi:transposase-like protein
MKTDTTNAMADTAEGTLFPGDDWFDPLEAGVRTRIRSFPKSQWKSIRTSNAIVRHEKFKRRIKTQTVLPSAETAAVSFWALLASVR